MIMINSETVVYSINVEDLQNVAEEEFGRKLTDEEIHLVENKLGDFIDWDAAIAAAIQQCLQLETVDDE
jgi:hypothetical protein